MRASRPAWAYFSSRSPLGAPPTPIAAIGAPSTVMRVWMHAGFYLLLASSAARYVSRHGVDAQGRFVLGLVLLLAVAYAVAMVWGVPMPRGC